jgi:hypothetical protein
MYNIEKTQNGFIFNNLEYILTGENEILSESQCHFDTEQGTILLDISCTIDGNEYNDINLFVQALKSE